MLEVGDIIYMLDRKTQALVPCMVVEKVSSVTMQGENIHHVISPPLPKPHAIRYH